MKVLVTGGHGFLGWHVACRLRATRGIEAVRIGRDVFADETQLRRAVDETDVVLHLAGVNRAETPELVRAANIDLAHQLARALTSTAAPRRVVYANSIQADLDNPYGEGKAEAARFLASATSEVGGSMANILLPNLFGEHGRPKYNSFVATFCDALVQGESPTVMEDREIPLMHAQQAAEILISAASGSADEEIRPAGILKRVTEVLDHLEEIRHLYSLGEVPPLGDQFAVDLFNTYRSYAFPAMFPIHPHVNSDKRGDLMEAARSHGGTGQVFVSTTRPGQTRGEHYHLHKVERFVVVKGSAEIGLRRLFHDDVVTFSVDESNPGFVDMPTMWVHNIRNVGSDDLVTVFWADQLLDLENPDQYPEKVAIEVSV